MAAPRLIRVSAAALLLDCSTATVYRLAERRAIAVFRDAVTGRVRISADSVEQYIAANTVPARPVIDVTPLPRSRKPRAQAVPAPTPASAEDPPWKGFAFGPRRGRTATT